MGKEWLKDIKNGISKYKNDVVPLINQGYYGMAGMELQNAILILSLAIREMEQDELCSNILVLSARLEFLSKACLDMHDGGGSQKKLEYSFNLVEEKVSEVEREISPLLLN